MAEEMLK